MLRRLIDKIRSRPDYLASGNPEPTVPILSVADQEVDVVQRSPEALAREARVVRESARRAQEAAPVLADLRALGFEKDDVWLFPSRDGLVNSEAARQMLLRHLFGGTFSDDVQEAIARALGRVGFSEAVWQQLADRYRAGVGPHEAVGLAAALMENASRRRVPELVAMVRDPRLGESRVMLLARISRRLGSDGDSLVEEFLADPVLGVEARAIRHRREVARRARAKRAADPDRG